MKLFPKSKTVQMGRIVLLLIAGASLGLGIFAALNLKVLSSIPIWSICIVIVGITVGTMIKTE